MRLWKNAGLAASFLCVFFMLSCEGEKGATGPSGENGAYDKQIRLDFFGGSNSTADTAGKINVADRLVSFNKLNYAKVDSITFNALLYSDDTTASCIVELYNQTDNQVIANSAISSKKKEWTFVRSGNIYNALPSKEIDLTIRIKTSVQGKLVSYSSVSPGLLLYRK